MSRIFAALLLLSSYPWILWAADHVAVSPSDVLFLAHFNKDQGIEKGNIQNMLYKGTLTSGQKGFPFKDSKFPNEALNLVGHGRFLALSAWKNININQGTLQFMLKPQWKKDWCCSSVIFQLTFDKTKRAFGYCWNGINSFFCNKPPYKQSLVFTQHGNFEANRLVCPLDYSMHKWYQITLTWDATARKRSMYVDGKLIGSKAFHPFTKFPEEISFGGVQSWNALSLFDEIRILKRVLTEEEVKQDYDALMEGKEFPFEDTTKETPVSFRPVIPPKHQFRKGFTDTVFQCPFIDVTPKMDGLLTDPVWKNAYTVGEFRFSHKEVPPEAPTEIKLFHNSQAMYIGAIMHEPAMDTLVNKIDQMDLPSIFSDDVFEMVIDTSGKPQSFYHFAINSLGACYDAQGSNRVWNARGMEITTGKKETCWLLEIRIPFSAFRLGTPSIGDYWGVRVCRERHAFGAEYTANPKVIQGPFSKRDYFAKMFFVPGKNQYDISMRCEQKTFKMGTNHLKIEAENLSKLREKVEFRVTLHTSSGEVLDTKEDFFKPARQLVIPVDVLDDRTERLSISLRHAGKTLCGTVLDRGFDSTGSGLKALDEELSQMTHDLGKLSQLKHPLFQGVVQSIQRMKRSLRDYQESLVGAVRARESVPDETTAKIAALAYGFRLFREKYRYVVWETSPWEVGSPEALPPVDNKEDMVLEYRMAGNEREVKTFIVSGLLSGQRLDLRIVPRSCEAANNWLSADNFEVYQEPFVNHNGELITAPLIRAPGNIITITPGTHARVWVIFNSRHVAPGDYRTQLEIKPLHDYSIPNRIIPVHVKVWNFSLPETHEWPLDFFMWGPNLSALDETAMMRLMHDYHIKWTMTRPHNYTRGFVKDQTWFGRSPKGKKYDENLTRHACQDFFAEARKLKMKLVFAWGSGPDLTWHQIMTERLLKMGFTYDDFIFHGLLRDEFSRSDIPRQAAVRTQVRKALPKVQFMATYMNNPPPSGVTLKELEDTGLVDFFKIVAVPSSRSLKTRAFFRKHNIKMWPYRCWTQMQMAPILYYYRLYLWRGYLEQVDGLAMWCSYNSKGDDGFDARDGYDDGACWRGLDKKPIPTKRLEAIREGLEDIAYMDILKKQLVITKAKNIDTAHYEKLLSEIPKTILEEESQNRIDQWRLAVGGAIDELSRKLK